MTKAIVSKKPGVVLKSLRINLFTSEFFRSYAGVAASNKAYSNWLEGVFLAHLNGIVLLTS